MNWLILIINIIAQKVNILSKNSEKLIKIIFFVNGITKTILTSCATNTKAVAKSKTYNKIIFFIDLYPTNTNFKMIATQLN